jgi:hypothetical protein
VRHATFAALSFAGAAMLFLSGCPDNPDSADTWIAKLDDPKQMERAVTELQNLCNPKAIEPLGQTWKRNNKPTRVLQVVIELSRELTAGPGGTAEQKFCTDFVKTGRPASWDKSLPFLREAIEDVDSNSQRSIDDAVKAAEALGESQLPDGAQILVDAINKNMQPKDNAQRVRLTSIAALAKYTDPGTKKTAVVTLANVIRKDPTTQPPQIVGAAINTLGDLRVPEALPILIEALYRAPLFFQQVHRALVASGPAVSGELRKILRHEHNDVNALFKAQKLDKYCGDKGDAAPSECQEVSAMDNYAALVIGDLHDPAAVPDLLTALARPAKPAYFQNFNPSPPAQNAILDALRKIGDPSAASAVLALAANPKTDEQLRPVATSVYGFVSTDGSEKAGNTSGLKWLAGVAADNDADQALRLAASESYARLADTADDTKVLATQAAKYSSAARDAVKERDSSSADYPAKMKAFEDLRQPFLTAQANVERAKIEYDKAKALVNGDPKKVPSNVLGKLDEAKKKLADLQKNLDEARAAWSKAGPKKAFDEANKEYGKAQTDYNDAKGKLEKAKADAGGDVTKVDPDVLNEATLTKYMWDWIKTNVYLPTKELYDALDQKSNGYKGYQRGFENHIARIEIAIHCKSDLKCYADTLSATGDAIFTRMKNAKLIDVKDDKEWTADDKDALRIAQIERAMLELRKQGAKAQPQLATLLDHEADKATPIDRLIRQSILLAVPRIAPLPCPDCKTKLEAAVAKGAGKQELNELTYETQLLVNYYSWAGSK